MRVGILTQWYDPEPGPAALPGVLARGLEQRGHDVRVLTGFPNYPSGEVAPGYRIRRSMREVQDGVALHRVALYPSHSSSTVERMANYGSFGLSAAVNGIPSMRGLDAMWVNYSPVTVGLAMFAARYGLAVPQVTHVLDLWPDTLQAVGRMGSSLPARAVHGALDGWCRMMYAASTSVAYISPGVGQVLHQRGVPDKKLHYVPMWADEALYRPGGPDLRSKLGLSDDQIVLLYAGTLGGAQALESLIDACALVTNPAFVCLIAGSGTEEERLRRRAASAGATNVRFLGRLPQDQMPRLMATSDLTYVGLRPHPLSAITMPSKVQAGLASGRAILAAVEGDVARVVTESNAGFTADPLDARSIAASIREACLLGRPVLNDMGRVGRAYYERTFSVNQGVSRIESLLFAAAEQRTGAPRTPSRSRDARRIEIGEPRFTPETPGDVPELARAHGEAFPGFFLSQLGEPFLAEFYRGFLSDRSAVTVVARGPDGTLLGAAVGTVEPAGFFRRLVTRRLLGFGIASAQAVLRHPRAAPRLIKAVRYRGETPAGQDGALLSSVFVTPSAQGQGIGGQLLDRWVALAAGLGAHSAYLTTDARGNEKANAFYEGCGWQLAGSYTTEEGREMHQYTKGLES